MNFVDPWGLEGKKVIPDMTENFIKRLINAAKRSLEFDRRYYNRLLSNHNKCENETTWIEYPGCKYAELFARVYIQGEKYWEYKEKAFGLEWNLKRNAYKNTYNILVGNQIRNNDDAGNFLIGYTLIPANISLNSIKKLSNIDAIWRMKNRILGKDARTLMEQRANELRDNEFIDLGYRFYQKHGMDISTDKLKKFLNR